MLADNREIDLGEVLDRDQYICVHWFYSLMDRKQKQSLAAWVTDKFSVKHYRLTDEAAVRAFFYDSLRNWFSLLLPELEVIDIPVTGETVVNTLQTMTDRVNAGSDILKAYFTADPDTMNEGVGLEMDAILEEAQAISDIQYTIFFQVFVEVIKAKKLIKQIERNKGKQKSYPVLVRYAFAASNKN